MSRCVSVYGPQAGFGPPTRYPQWCVQWSVCSCVSAVVSVTVPLPTGKSLSPCGGVVCGECTAVCTVV